MKVKLDNLVTDFHTLFANVSFVKFYNIEGKGTKCCELILQDLYKMVRDIYKINIRWRMDFTEIKCEK